VVDSETLDGNLRDPSVIDQSIVDSAFLPLRRLVDERSDELWRPGVKPGGGPEGGLVDSAFLPLRRLVDERSDEPWRPVVGIVLTP
jgi:hypothetical protein